MIIAMPGFRCSYSAFLFPSLLSKRISLVDEKTGIVYLWYTAPCVNVRY